ncbi:hypothetical protein [Pelagibius sp. Alg239-R121]|uniref:hypothetical protein n=1 Tax=Pelagibius sp. Alg239-R121 TaxID=2993448 RepID=UPI0024A710C3|nr:hypothetical protein [Pelagibius sp. Alg239-R121]
MSVNLQALNVSAIFPPMLSAAKDVAGSGWDEIRTIVKIEFKAVAKRIKEIGKAFADGEINKPTAKMLMKMVRNNVVAAIALVTNQIMIVVEKIVNAALKIIKDVVNTALGFAIL